MFRQTTLLDLAIIPTDRAAWMSKTTCSPTHGCACFAVATGCDPTELQKSVIECINSYISNNPALNLSVSCGKFIKEQDVLNCLRAPGEYPPRNKAKEFDDSKAAI